MRKYFDFIIEDNDLYKKVLRFYPKKSHVHSFDDEPPKSWGRVYKTYMTFSVLLYDKDSLKQCRGCHKIYDYYQEEGEGLQFLREVLNEIKSNSFRNSYEVRPFGYGTDWFISKKTNITNKIYYEFFMVDKLTSSACYFELGKEEIINFYNILNNFLEYMLEHSEGI